MGKNIMAGLISELSGKVGGDDIAKNIVKGMQMQEGATRSSVQKQLRSLLRDIDTDDITRRASYLDKFTTDAEGNVVFKDINIPVKPARMPEPEHSVLHKDVPGQTTMYQDGTGQMTTSSLKAKEYSKFITEDSGQLSFDLHEDINGSKITPEGPNVAKQAENSTGAQSSVGSTNSAYGRQQSMFANENGDLFYSKEHILKTEGPEIRAAQLEENEKNFVKKLGSRAADAITGEGSDVSKLFGGRKMRNEQRMAANREWVKTGDGAYQSKRQYYNSVKNSAVQNQKIYTNVVNGDKMSYNEIAQDISKTAPLDNSGVDFHLPVWGKVAIGAGAGFGIATLLDNDGY